MNIETEQTESRWTDSIRPSTGSLRRLCSDRSLACRCGSIRQTGCTRPMHYLEETEDENNVYNLEQLLLIIIRIDNITSFSSL